MNESGRAVLARRIARNSVLNLSTTIVISGLNLVFIPLMLHAFGTELYGVLSFTWAVLANLSWLDFGFGRTSTRFVAQELEKGRPMEACFWAWTALVAQAAMGSLGAALLWFLAPFLVEHIRVSGEAKELVILTLRLFAFALPIDFATKSMTGVLQAGQRFDWVNGLNVFGAVGTFVVYTAGIIHGHDFYLIVYGLFAARIVSLAGAVWGATHVLPGAHVAFEFDERFDKLFEAHMADASVWFLAHGRVGDRAADLVLRPIHHQYYRRGRLAASLHYPVQPPFGAWSLYRPASRRRFSPLSVRSAFGMNGRRFRPSFSVRTVMC